jgi:hypothetical protein
MAVSYTGSANNAMAIRPITCYKTGGRAVVEGVHGRKNGPGLPDGNPAETERSIMNPENQIRRNLPLLVFAGAVLLCTAAYLLYVYLQSRGYAGGDHGFGKDVGEGLGSAGLSALVVVYARTAFKLLVRRDSFWKRLEPFDIDYAKIKTASGKVLFYLNKSHPYFGVSAIALIYLHRHFISPPYTPLPLFLVLALLAWQGVWGLVLKTRLTPAFLKKRSHLFHSQLITGALILVLAGLGHFLLDE